MNNLDMVKFESYKPIDPVFINNQYAIYSTIQNDVLFSNDYKKPIFCGGLVREFGRNVFNIKKNQLVGYISHKIDSCITLSSKLIFKLNKSNHKLIFSLPYASYAMKILRQLNAKIGQNVLIIGLDFFSLLLLKILKLSGANVWIIKTEEKSLSTKVNDNDAHLIIDSFDKRDKIINEYKIHKVLILREINQSILEILNKIYDNLEDKVIFTIRNNQEFNYDNNKKVKFTHITKTDVGLSDPNYFKGIKYPYSYIRWDYRKNLEYFIYLVENEYINIEFLKFNYIEVNSISMLASKVKSLEINYLFLFKLLSKS